MKEAHKIAISGMQKKKKTQLFKNLVKPNWAIL